MSWRTLVIRRPTHIWNVNHLHLAANTDGAREHADIADLISLRSALVHLLMLATLADTESAPADVSKIRAICNTVDVRSRTKHNSVPLPADK